MEVKKGIEIIEAACRVPLKQIAANSGEQGEVIIEKLLSGEKGDESIGWVSDLPCDIRREGGQSLLIGGSSLVILEGKTCNPL